MSSTAYPLASTVMLEPRRIFPRVGLQRRRAVMLEKGKSFDLKYPVELPLVFKCVPIPALRNFTHFMIQPLVDGSLQQPCRHTVVRCNS